MNLGPYESNSIIHGDCLEIMPQLPDGCFDAIICDLPYQQTSCHWDAMIPFESLWLQYKRLIKKAGAVVLFGSQPFTSALVMSNPKWFRYEWVWEKDVHSNFANARHCPLKYHENIIVFSGDSHLYNPQMRQTEKLSRPSGRGEKNRPGLSNKLKRVETRDTLMKYPKSVLYFNKPKHNDGINGNLHPTQKPVALLSYLVRTYTNPGDLILDCCAGSGTLAIAAIETGRNWFCIEKDAGYFEIAKARIEERQRQPEQTSMELA